MKELAPTRAVALALSAATFAFLFIHDTFRLDNLFLVPDLLLCLVLVIGALLPRRSARPVLLAGFAAAAAVFSVSVASYAVRGDLGLASLLGVVLSLAMVVLLTRALAVEQKP
ncbi:hypothetical protein GCM10009718_17730 [Isoptericola halotolerans]|uniref:Uncharacterized protein n=1 Tax=Isoptericola halotolerans TaxID=300560 RepID=A0ABX2A7F8_9MICO|nr:hypothetical protein [Isoptericola halotolerans]NOV98640.1 hypothetical protein [Isoptericola halotolerans]